MSFERNVETITTASADIELFVVPWDSRTFGFPVAQIERAAVKRDGDHGEAMSALRSWLSRNDIRLATCRLPSNRLPESMLLEDCGFRFVEIVHRPVLCPLPTLETSFETIVVSEATPDDLPDIESVAASAFTTGRFFLDWRLDRDASGRRYRQWVRNSFADTRQRVLKATLENDFVGFFIIEDRPDRSVYWHLTAVSTTWQGRGLGKRLWSIMIARHRVESIERIETTISAHNARAMNLYARLGFTFDAPQATFHWVLG